MKYFLIAGEASGDLHGSNLIKEIKKTDNDAVFECWGGDLMEKAGAALKKHYRNHAYMGFIEVVKNISSIVSNITKCKQHIIDFNPDVVILIDYPGFNLRIAKFAHQNNFRVFYYISPKIWAWNQKRVFKIKKYVHRMFTIFPFETDFYGKFGFGVDYVGNPLLDAVANFQESNSRDFKLKHGIDAPVIALLPGSRQQEISGSLPVMLSVLDDFKEYQFVVGGAPGIDPEMYAPYLSGTNVALVFGETYDLLKASNAALVTSGTATLETALFDVPQVVCYNTGNLSYFIAKQLIKVEYISLVNLILDRAAVTELIQADLNHINLHNELLKILTDEESRIRMMESYRELKEKLGGKGASERAALKMVQYLRTE